jgi:hypothetical protein
MFAFPGSWKVYLAVEPVDMRKHFDGLWAQAEQHLGEDRPKIHGRPTSLRKTTSKLLSVSRVTIWRMKRAGQLNPVEILPGTWRYRYSEIAEIARGLEVQTAH